MVPIINEHEGIRIQRISTGIYRQNTDCGKYVIQVNKRGKLWIPQIRTNDSDFKLERACIEMGDTKAEALEIALEDYQNIYSPA